MHRELLNGQSQTRMHTPAIFTCISDLRSAPLFTFSLTELTLTWEVLLHCTSEDSAQMCNLKSSVKIQIEHCAHWIIILPMGNNPLELLNNRQVEGNITLQ
mmetsp:Transcript_25227/g.60665  ORF Transcript_25227/g.60665 Transcript_25227/m.60665 type:complete len:101 (+) Transcript_25227:70-372(+)